MLRPYINHNGELALARAVRAEDYVGAAPEVLHRDIQKLRTWWVGAVHMC